VWSDEPNLLASALYPEVFQLDTTANTNLYNYPLLFLVGVNGENQGDNWVTSLLPDQTRLTFLWLLSYVLPKFVGPSLGGVQVIISDGDAQITSAIDYCIAAGVFPTKAYRLLCFWHTINLPIQNCLGYLGGDMCAHLTFVLKQIARTASKPKVHELWNAISETLDELSSPAYRQGARDVLENIRSKEAHWCRAWFPDARNYDEITSGRSETENRHHKADNRVHSKTAMPKTVRVAGNRMDRRKTERVSNIIQSARHPIMQTYGETSVPAWVFDELTKHGADLLEPQWELSESYSVTQNSQSSFRVLFEARNEKEEMDDDGSDTELQLSAVVVVVQNFLICGCSFSVSLTMICRHVLAVLRHLGALHIMNAMQVHLRWHKNWSNGMYMGIYHRHHNDGFSGVKLAFPLPEYNSSFLESEDFATPSSPLSFDSPPPSISLALKPYQFLQGRFRDVEKSFLGAFAHSQEGAEWAAMELNEFCQETFRKYAIMCQDGKSVSDGAFATDRPLNKTRAKFRFESGKTHKRKRPQTCTKSQTAIPSPQQQPDVVRAVTPPDVLVFDTYPKESGRITRSQTVAPRVGTPPLEGIIFG
jgi:hypothetical protein